MFGLGKRKIYTLFQIALCFICSWLFDLNFTRQRSCLFWFCKDPWVLLPYIGDGGSNSKISSE